MNANRFIEDLGLEKMHCLMEDFYRTAQDSIQRYGGTIWRTLDDGFEALFGVPTVHEDHIQRATLAALDLRRHLQGGGVAPGIWIDTRLAVRIGLGSGQIILGTLRGNGQYPTITPVGDTFQSARELHGIAASNEILVRDHTARSIRRHIRMVPLTSGPGPQPFGPSGYKILGPQTSRSPLETLSCRKLSKFVGRQAAIAQLQGLWAQVEKGHGQVVGITGEPGLGKSRLLHEFHRRLQRNKAICLQGRCTSYGQTTPYLPLLALLKHLSDITPMDNATAMVVKTRQSLQKAKLDPEENLPYLTNLLGIKIHSEKLVPDRKPIFVNEN